MPRPRLRPGEYGTVRAVKQDDGSWLASARYRRTDGDVRRAFGTGRTKTAAEARLRELIGQKIGETASLGLTPESTVAELAAAHYKAQAERRPPLAPRTLVEIRNVIDLHIVPRLGALTLRECTAPIVDHAVTSLAAVKAPQAKKMRWVLSMMFKRAVRLGAVPASPVTGVEAVRVERAAPKALSLDDLMAVRAVVRSQPAPRTNRRKGAASADVLEFLVATGCRAAEVLGLAWEDVHLDATVPWVFIHRQVVSVPGEGLRRTPTKEQDTRALPLAPFAVAMLRRLADAKRGDLVFPSATGGLRDPKNMRTIWNRALQDTEWSWVTQKVLRKTVATYLDGAEGSATAAQWLGHADDRVTRQHYIEQRVRVLALGSIADLGEN